MNNLYLRNYIELCYIIVNEKVHLQTFISYFYLSNYEYAHDMEKLSEVQSNFGISINVRGSYIVFQIQNEELFRSKYHYCRAFYYRHRYTFQIKRDALLEAYIGRSFLWSKDYVIIDDIAEEIGYSRSNIRNAVKAARTFLKSYDITVDNVPYHGLKTSGNEFDIRRCFISLYSISDINVIPVIDDVNILEGYRSDVYDAVVDIVNHTLLHFGYSIINIEKRRIVNYLIIQNARIKAGNHLEKLTDLKNMHHYHDKYYEIAEAISITLEKRLHFGPYSECEILSVSVLLMQAESDIYEIIKTVTSIYSDEVAYLINEIISYVQGSYKLTLYEDTIFYRYLTYAICILLLKYNDHMLLNEGTDLGGGPSLNNEYPLLGRIRYDITQRLYLFFNASIPETQMNDLILLFSYLIQDLKLVYDKLNIAIISRNSTIEPFLLRDLIKKNVNAEYYQKLDCLWYNKAIDEKSYSYDLIISDTVPQRYEARIFPYSDLENQLNSLNDYIRANRDLCRNTLSKVYSIEFSPKIMLAQLQKYTGIKEQDFHEEFQTARQFNRNIVMIFQVPNMKKNILMVGNFKNKVLRSGMKCSSYLLLAANIHSDNLLFFNTLLHELVYDYAFLERLIEYPDLSVINDQMNAVLK